MIVRWLTILVLVGVCSFVSNSQGSESIATSEVQRLQREKEKFIREQAILVLKGNLLDSRSIKDLRHRAGVIAEASAILLEHDRPFAEDALLTFINQSLTEYKELLSKEKRGVDETITLQSLDYAIKKCLKILAQKDVEKANLLQTKYFGIRQESLTRKNLNENLDLAAEGFDFDEQQTIALLSAILQLGVPSNFPKLIFDLRSKNPAAADLLIRRAIQNVALNQNYRAADAIYLSVIVFGESSVLMPILGDSNNPNSLGAFTSPSGSSSGGATSEHIQVYYSSALNFFNTRLTNQLEGFDSAGSLIQAYFLIEKLRFYNQVSGSVNPEGLNRIIVLLAPLMHTAGISQQTRSDVSGYAERLVNSNNPLGLDDGSDFFDKAEKAKTPEEKLDHLISGIIRLIDSKEFEKAERKIFDIQNSDIRDSLYTLTYMRAAFDALDSEAWNEFEKKTEKISDKGIKAFLYLKGMSGFKAGAYTKSLASEFAIKAENNIQAITDQTAKASAFVFLTALVYSSNPDEGVRLLPAMLRSIDNAPDYHENKFEVKIRIPTRQAYYAEYIGSGSFRRLFYSIGKIDWSDSQVQAVSIKAKGLQSIAQVSAAKAVLRTKELEFAESKN